MRIAVAVLVSLSVFSIAGCGGRSHQAMTTTTAPTPPESTTSATQATTTTTSPPVPQPPTEMSWKAAGAFVWHETDVSPELLGEEMRAAGFGWVAVFLHNGLVVDPVEGNWVSRFRAASGLSVGGWGVLQDHPAQEATLASSLLDRYGLDFYIADAEAPYAYSGPSGPSEARYERSRLFLDTFRRLRPDLPLGLSSYCRPDTLDLDWRAWAAAGAAFLPQAYVNDFGASVAPAACVNAARGFFAADDVHPTVGVYTGRRGALSAQRYAGLLAQAGTVGFSVYLAETGMTNDQWSAYGQAIAQHSIAQAPR